MENTQLITAEAISTASKSMVQEQQARVTHLSHDGRGIAHVDGKITFIFGALPGEEVIFSYAGKRSKFDEAIAVKILSPSPLRSAPNCQFFGQCGGCTLQHMEQDLQISYKEGVLREQFKHFGNIELSTMLPPLKASPYGYRRKARCSVRYVKKKDRVLIGFRELHNPRFLAEINRCEVLHPLIGNLLAPLQDCISSLEKKDQVAQIEAAVGDNATALIIRHLEALPKADEEKIALFAEHHGLWIFLQPKGYDSIHKFYPADQNSFLSYPITDDIVLDFHPADFTQINEHINRQMIKQALNLLELSSKDIVLDLFCGIGNFSLPLAKKVTRVLGIEGDPQLVKRAIMNAEKNQCPNASFFCADLNKVETLPTILPAKYNKILLDPPRSGAKALLENIPLDGVDTIVYVSCNPSTLARDAGILAGRGYLLTSIGVMDMFTHTEHVEAMAAFKKM